MIKKGKEVDPTTKLEVARQKPDLQQFLGPARPPDLPWNEPEPEGLTPAEARAQAKAWLKAGDQGRQEMLTEIREGLITAMLLEREAGENPKDAGKSTEANARQSRKQFKEFAELVMQVEETI